MLATMSLTERPKGLYNTHMKIKKTLKGLGLWTRKQDIKDQIWFTVTTVAMLLCLLVLVSAFQ